MRLIAVAAVLSFIAVPASAAITIATIGDSTVDRFPAIRQLEGWGQRLGEYVNPSQVTVLDHASSGASTRSYLNSGLWDAVIAANPTYALIQFGHNDTSTTNDRLTSPGEVPDPIPDGKTPREYYRANLSEMVTDALAMGTVPILVKPMERLLFTSSGTIDRKLAPFAAAVDAVAAAHDIQVIDLNSFSIAWYESIGLQAARPYHAILESGAYDPTHFSALGARVYAEEVARQLYLLRPELRSVVVPEPSTALMVLPAIVFLRRHHRRM